MTIAREEIFGPVMSVLAFDTEDEASPAPIPRPTASPPASSPRDLARAHRVVARLDAGTTWINAYNLTPVEMPFGGVKAIRPRPRERPRRPRPLEPRQVGLRRHRPRRGARSDAPPRRRLASVAMLPGGSADVGNRRKPAKRIK